jgi:Cu-Zn family superoxide dismutase
MRRLRPLLAALLLTAAVQVLASGAVMAASAAAPAATDSPRSRLELLAMFRHPPVQHASATLVDVEGSPVGFALFLDLPDGSVLVTVHARGLTPGEHGIHIHETGACTPSFAAAGGHFNPTGAMHGSHAGDLGNIVANPAGIASMVVLTTQFTLSPGVLSLHDVDGSALVIHAHPDDLMSDPSGNSGARVACGVVR